MFLFLWKQMDEILCKAKNQNNIGRRGGGTHPTLSTKPQNKPQIYVLPPAHNALGHKVSFCQSKVLGQ
jgi:hypothetical protein